MAEVKGYPTMTYARGERAGQPKKTQPNVQARALFAVVILEAMLRRSQYPKAEVVIALPDVGQYHRLVARVRGSLHALALGVRLATELGQVIEFD